MKCLIFFVLALSLFEPMAMATWSKPARDFYDVLGVPKNASDDDVKQAYRRMARKYHPDVNSGPGAKIAEEKFKEAKEAYEVLSNSSHRAVYDNYGGYDLSPKVAPGDARPPGYQAQPPPPEPPPPPPPEKVDSRKKIRDYAMRPMSEGGVGLKDDQVDAFITRFAKEYGTPGRTLDQAMAMHYEDLKYGFRAYYDFARLPTAQGGLGHSEAKAKELAIEATQRYSRHDIDSGIVKYRAAARFNSAVQSAPKVVLKAEHVDDAKKAFAILTRPAADGGFGMSDEAALKIAAEAAKYPRGGNWEEQLKPVRERYLKAAKVYELSGLQGLENSDLANLAIRDPAEFDKKFSIYKDALEYAAFSRSAGGLDLKSQPGKVDEFVRAVMASGSPEEYLKSHVVAYRRAYMDGIIYEEAVKLAQAATQGSCSLAYAKLSRLFK